jgi:hypothetical protein
MILMGPQVRIKIDNHIDNTLQSGENRGSILNGDRSTAPNPHLVVPQRPLPALVRGERSKGAESELTTVGEGWPKKGR